MVVTSVNCQVHPVFSWQTFLQGESRDQVQISEDLVPKREQVDRPKTTLKNGPYIYEMYKNIVHGFCIYIYVHYQKLLCMPCSFDL